MRLDGPLSWDDSLPPRFLGKPIQSDLLHQHNNARALPDETGVSKRKDILSYRRGPFQESKTQKSQPSLRERWELAGHRALVWDGLWPEGGQPRTEEQGGWGQAGRGRSQQLLTGTDSLRDGGTY